MANEKATKVVLADGEEDIVASSAVEEPVSLQDNVQTDEVDDLFGDDEEEEEINDIDSKPADENGIVADDEENAADGGDESEMDFLVEKEPAPRELRQVDLDVVRHPQKFKQKDELLYDAKIPNFLSVEPTRFEGQVYLETLLQEESEKTIEEVELDRLRAENTVRWRYTKDADGKLIIESNTQIVQWSDGSFSLKLGDEYFNVVNTKLEDTFLATYSEESSLLQTDGVFTHAMKFLPTSTNSAIHKKLTSAIKARQSTKAATQSVFVNKDPEREARDLERQQEQLIRERRRRELKERKEAERLSEGGSVQRSATESYYSLGGARAGNEYEEDDFLVQDDEEDNGYSDDEDDEEDDLAVERLKRVKRDGEAKYREGSVDGSNPADNDNEDDNDEDDGVVNSRKKRRVIESDDDDE